MRKYSLVFMEQKIGVSRLTPIAGAEGEASFEAVDDEAAQVHVREHYLAQLQNCVRAELTSMAMLRDASGAVRLVDDSMKNPHFQEAYVRYDRRRQQIEVDFVSTQTGIMPESFRRSTM